MKRASGLTIPPTSQFASTNLANCSTLFRRNEERDTSFRYIQRPEKQLVGDLLFVFKPWRAPLFLRRLDLERIWYVVFVVLDSLLFGQHALMEDTANQNTAGFLPVKHNMLALLHAPQPRADFIILPTERGIIGKELATIFKLAYIAVSLDFAPGVKAVKADVEQIGFGTMRKSEPGHALTGRRGVCVALAEIVA